MWFRSIAASGEYVEGTAAVLMGVSFMLLGYLIFSAVRYVISGKEQRLDPITFKNKALLALCFILSIIHIF